MTVRLRAHHLLCSLTFKGEGYSAAFVANYERVVARLSGGEDVLIVQGPDDVCSPLLADSAVHCLTAGVIERDEIAAHQVGRLLGVSIGPGTRLELGAAKVETMRRAFAERSTRDACHACEWSQLCSDIAEQNFHQVKFLPLA